MPDQLARLREALERCVRDIEDWADGESGHVLQGALLDAARAALSTPPAGEQASTTPFRADLLRDLADIDEAANYLRAAMEDSQEMFRVAVRDVMEAAREDQRRKDAEIAANFVDWDAGIAVRAVAQEIASAIERGEVER